MAQSSRQAWTVRHAGRLQKPFLSHFVWVNISYAQYTWYVQDRWCASIVLHAYEHYSYLPEGSALFGWASGLICLPPAGSNRTHTHKRDKPDQAAFCSLYRSLTRHFYASRQPVGHSQNCALAHKRRHKPCIIPHHDR